MAAGRQRDELVVVGLLKTESAAKVRTAKLTLCWTNLVKAASMSWLLELAF